MSLVKGPVAKLRDKLKLHQMRQALGNGHRFDEKSVEVRSPGSCVINKDRNNIDLTPTPKPTLEYDAANVVRIERAKRERVFKDYHRDTLINSNDRTSSGVVRGLFATDATYRIVRK
jgi:hypothetical protein